MPTYSYRCLSCRAVQSVVQGMLEQFAPACPDCGGFTEKVMTQAPTLLSRQPESSPEEPETHHCGSSCVLHRHPNQHPNRLSCNQG